MADQLVHNIICSTCELKWSELQAEYLFTINIAEKHLDLSGTFWTSAIIQEAWMESMTTTSSMDPAQQDDPWT